MLALSIRQPYAELILRGIKTAELRSMSTTIVGERVQRSEVRGQKSEIRSQTGESIIVVDCNSRPPTGFPSRTSGRY
jgi:hypothetical protein